MAGNTTGSTRTKLQLKLHGSQLFLYGTALVNLSYPILSTPVLHSTSHQSKHWKPHLAISKVEQSQKNLNCQCKPLQSRSIKIHESYSIETSPRLIAWRMWVCLVVLEPLEDVNSSIILHFSRQKAVVLAKGCASEWSSLVSRPLSSLWSLSPLFSFLLPSILIRIFT